MKYLREIQSELLISRFIDKEPYIKTLTNDKIINLTGESGSGKSYFSQKYKTDDNYLVIDTDEVFNRFDKSEGINKELGTMFRNKYETLPDICNDFELIYKEILNYLNDVDKIIVIDSAQFRNIKDINILKGKIIVMRTSINKCYERCINRWLKNKPSHTQEELEKYKNKKINMFSWYNALNNFIEKIDSK